MSKNNELDVKVTFSLQEFIDDKVVEGSYENRDEKWHVKFSVDGQEFQTAAVVPVIYGKRSATYRPINKTILECLYNQINMEIDKGNACVDENGKLYSLIDGVKKKYKKPKKTEKKAKSKKSSDSEYNVKITFDVSQFNRDTDEGFEENQDELWMIRFNVDGQCFNSEVAIPVIYGKNGGRYYPTKEKILEHIEDEIGMQVYDGAACVDEDGKLYSLIDGYREKYGKLKKIDISERTSVVRDAISKAIKAEEFGVDLKRVTEGMLEGIWELDLREKDIKNLKKGDFEGLLELRKLDLSRNDLKDLPKKIFKGLKKLSDISLENNQLDSLDRVVFKGLPNLGLLNLSGNNLKGLPKGMFDKLYELKILDLRDNNFDKKLVDVFPKDLYKNLSVLESQFEKNNKSVGIGD